MKLIKEYEPEYVVGSANDVHALLEEFIEEDREYFVVIGLNTRNKVLFREIVTIGTLNQSIVHPREIYKKAIIMSCNSIIIAHNHPGGNPEPSEEDIRITQRLLNAGQVLDIPLLDHVIVAKEGIYSFKENNKL